MKLLRSALVVWLLAVPRTALAQQPAGAPKPADVDPGQSADRGPAPTTRKPALDASLLSPMLTTPNLPSWIALTPTTFGIFTFATPETRGEFVSVTVPVGDLTMRAAHAVGGVARRRAERAAHEEVAHTVEALQVAMSNQPASNR
jgi:hypothetical protein